MQAVLIVAHKNINQVVKLTNLLSHKFEVYVHIDNGHVLSESEKKVLTINHVHYIQEITVHWGAWSIVRAQILLMKLALKNPKITYIHLISGQDWPTQNIEKIYNFYEEQSQIYMTYESAKGIKKAFEPIIWWQKYYFNYDQFNRRTFIGKFYHRFLLLIQTIFRVNKFKQLKINLEIYDGSNWADIPRDAMEFALNYLEQNPNLQRMFETSFCSDEFWLQTILVNQPKLKTRIVNDNHRYIKWIKQNGSFPAILDQRDFNLIPKEAQFARKIDPRYSNQLIRQLDQRNHN